MAQNNIVSKNTSFERMLNLVDDAKALVVLAHGAGAGMDHQFLENLTSLLNLQKISVIRFNFPYMVIRKEQDSRRPPDRMPKLIESYLNELALLDAQLSGAQLAETELADSKLVNTQLPLFICGKSMGGRVGATLMNKAVSGDALARIKGAICIGYPFHPQKKPEKLRLEPLQDTQKKILIVQGERDALGSQAEIESYEFSSLCELVYLPDGDHDLKPRVKSGHTHQAHIKTAVQAIVRFIDENK